MTPEEIVRLCLDRFPQLVRAANIIDPRRGRVRLDLVDGSFVDIHHTPDGRYSYHWQRGDEFRGRFNNAPHFDEIETAPHHHHLADGRVVPSHEVRGVTESDIAAVLRFIGSVLNG